MEQGKKADAMPIATAERVDELDVLRGFALLGVLLANFASWLGPPFLATEAQLAQLSSSQADRIAEFLVDWLVSDKANTMFAILFGIGFWIQMGRIEARGGDFRAIYLRRLTILLAIGLLHFFTIWPFDILHLYALAGFCLFAMRGLGNRVLLGAGLVLAVGGRAVTEFLFRITGVSEGATSVVYSEAGIMARQGADSTLELINRFSQLAIHDWILSGLGLAWFFYVLGRFMIGAFISRMGWLQRASQLLAGYRRVLLVALPLGLAGEFATAAFDAELWGWLGDVHFLRAPIHFFSVLFLVAGYTSLLILVLHSAFRPLAAMFAPVGRMALTNYVIQSFAVGWVLYPAWAGPGLAGQIGTASGACYSFGIFAGQIVFSYIWLKLFLYGPLEYLWRWGTYGNRPAFIRQPA